MNLNWCQKLLVSVISVFSIMSVNAEECLFFVTSVFLKTRGFFWFLQYTNLRCFELVDQNAVDARHERNQDRESIVLAKTMNLIENSSSGYEIKDCSQHMHTKCVKGSHVDNSVNNRSVKSLNESPHQFLK